MEPIALLEILRRHVAMIVVVTIIVTLAGYGASFLLPTRYTATALLLVRPQQPIKLSTQKEKEFLDFPIGVPSAVETASKTYIEMVKSRALVGEVVRQLQLDKEPEAKGGGTLTRALPAWLRQYYVSVKDPIKAFAKRSISILLYGKVIEQDPFAKAVDTVMKGLTLKSITDTYTFTLEYKGKDPQQAADIANTAAKKLIDFANNLRTSEAHSQEGHLKDEVSQAREQVNQAALRLENYKKVHSTLIYKSEYDAQLRVIADLEVELAKAEAAQVASQNTPSTVNLVAKRQRLLQLIAEHKKDLAPMPEIERQLTHYEQDVKDAVAGYEALERQYQQLNLNQSYSMPEARLVSGAIAPQLPTSPVRTTIALVSLIAGMGAGAGLAFLLEFLNRRVRSIEDVENFVGLKVIATIPDISELHERAARLY